MKNLSSQLQKHINNGFYQGVEWKINYQENTFQGKIGYMDLSNKKTIETNSIYRIWSMTKPIVSLVALQLIEENKIQLKHPLNMYLPIFNNLKILNDDLESGQNFKDLKKMPTIEDLILHTAGFSYNFFDNKVALEYSQKKLFYSSNTTLEEEIEILATCPLLFEPSTKWHYSVSIDVLARIIEVVEQDTLQNILSRRIFLPLEMTDAGFSISNDKQYRLMKSYEYALDKKELSELSSQGIGLYGYPLKNSNYARGGHGLYCSLNDYAKFANMLLSGKTKSGANILSEKMLRLASTNHIQNNLLPLEIKIPGDEDATNDLEPYGWGLGFRVLIDLEKSNYIKSLGEFGWSGAAKTYFLVDRKNSLTAVLMTQVLNGDNALLEDFTKQIYENL